MPQSVNIHYAKTHLSRLLVSVSEGEEVIIAKSGKPLAKLVSVENQKPRKPGRFEGQFISTEVTSAPLPIAELDLWGLGHPNDPVRSSPPTKKRSKAKSPSRKAKS